MFYPFKVSDHSSVLQYRVNETRLANLLLAPVPKVRAPVAVIKVTPNLAWAERLANGPEEPPSTVTVVLEDLIHATPDFVTPRIDLLSNWRALLHNATLLGLKLLQIGLGHIHQFCATVGRQKIATYYQVVGSKS